MCTVFTQRLVFRWSNINTCLSLYDMYKFLTHTYVHYINSRLKMGVNQSVNPKVTLCAWDKRTGIEGSGMK